MGKELEKLTGEELSSYVEQRRKDFKKNGDALCLAAGYGIKASDGTEKCNFTAFVSALSNATEIEDDNLEEGSQ